MNSNQNGGVLVTVMLSVLLVTSLIFSGWTFASRQDFKNNVDKKIEQAVQIAVDKAKTEKDNEFAEKEKKPLAAYNGPESLGKLTVSYPKTWSAYIDESSKTSVPVSGTMHPKFVPAGKGFSYALRFEIVASSYDQVVKRFEAKVKQGKTTANAFRLKKVSNTLGTRLEGELEGAVSGIMVILPFRDKTLKIWTESNSYYADFNNLVLPSVSFRP